MSGNWEGSEKMAEAETGGGPARPSRARVVALVVAGALGVGFAAWAIGQYLSSQRAVEPMGGLPSAEAGSPVAGSGREDAPAGEIVNVHVVVRMRDETGAEVTIGTAIPSQVSLTLKGEDGRPYEARFDRVGVWLMEVPPGTYRVPLDQPELRDWKWTLSGKNVTPGSQGSTIRLAPGQVPPRIDLLLYQ